MTTAVATPTAPPVLGLEEAARLLSMSRESIQALRGKDNAHRRNGTAPEARILFPLEDWVVSGNPVWKPSTIRQYGRKTKRIT